MAFGRRRLFRRLPRRTAAASSGRSGKAARGRGGARPDSLGSENAGAAHETVDLFLAAFGAGDLFFITLEHQFFKTVIASIAFVFVDGHMLPPCGNFNSVSICKIMLFPENFVKRIFSFF
jgi:hypothetical protein